jgi:hypothetical protein
LDASLLEFNDTYAARFPHPHSKRLYLSGQKAQETAAILNQKNNLKLSTPSTYNFEKLPPQTAHFKPLHQNAALHSNTSFCVSPAAYSVLSAALGGTYKSSKTHCKLIQPLFRTRSVPAAPGVSGIFFQIWLTP